MNAQTENNTEPDVVENINAKIESALQAFEAFLYDSDRQQNSDKLQLVKKHLGEIQKTLDLNNKPKVAEYCKSLEVLVTALANNAVQNKSDAHDVILGALNQLINYLQIKKIALDDVSPLLSVSEDIRAVSGLAVDLPKKLINLTQRFSELQVCDLIRTQEGCFDWIDIAVWQGDKFFVKDQSMAFKEQCAVMLASFKRKQVIVKLEATQVEKMSLLDEYLLAIIALLEDVANEQTVSPSVKYCLNNALLLLDSATEIIKVNKKESLAVAVLKQYREMLMVIFNQGCESTLANILVEKYQLCSLSDSGLACSKESRLRLGTPDKATLTRFFSNVSEDVKTINASLQSWADSAPSIENLIKLREFSTNLMHATKLAGYTKLSESFYTVRQNFIALEQPDSLEHETVESLATELMVITQYLVSYQCDSEEHSTQAVLAKLLITDVNQFCLALESENIDVNDQPEGAVDTWQSLIESAVQRYADAMFAAQFLNDESASKIVADSVNFAKECLLPLGGSQAPEVGQSLLKRFSRALHLTAKYFHARYIEQSKNADELLLQTQQYLAELHDKHSSIKASEQVVVSAPLSEIPLNNVEAVEVNDTQQALASQPKNYRPIEESLDDEIVEIFLEEAEEVCQLIGEQYAVAESENWQNNVAVIAAPMQELRRAYHTLKGSGRMAAAVHIGESAWLVEDMLNRIIDNSIVMNDARMSLLKDAGPVMEKFVAAFSQRVMPVADEYKNFIARVTHLITNDTYLEGPQSASDDIALLEQVVEEVTEKQDQVLGSDLVVESVTGPLAGNVDEPIVFDATVESDTPIEEPDQVGQASCDVSENNEIVTTENIPDENNNEIDQPLEAFDALEKQPEIESADLAEQNNADDVLQLIFKDEAKVQLSVLNDYLAQSTANQLSVPDEPLERALHTLAGGASVTNLESVAKIALPAEILVGQMRLRDQVNTGQYQVLQQVATWLEAYVNGHEPAAEQTYVLTDALNDLVELCFSEPEDKSLELESILHSCKSLYQADNFLRSWRTAIAPPNDFELLINELKSVNQAAHKFSAVTDLTQALLDTYQSFANGSLHVNAYSTAKHAHIELERMLDNVATSVQPKASTSVELLQVIINENQQLKETQNEQSGLVANNKETNIVDEVDDEILLIFLEESHELVEELEINVHRWIAKPSDASILDEILRLLHTIKGGARMAGLNIVGDLCHDYEEFLQTLSVKGKQVNQKTCKHVIDHLNALVTQLSDAEEKVKGIKTPEASTSKADDRPAEEFVRVQASSMEQLVNLAGETSISRSLIEQRMSDFGQAIEEIDSTVERLNEQLRRLEIETEAQIDFRKEQIEIERLEDFDPLEMDRYSHLQQLSRSLIESASDLQALKSTLVDKTRDVETLLIQQARINTELQEGLMRTRTVPLARTIIPRLRRTIRQVSGELDKPVKLEIANSEGELDRSIIERMVVPLEHVMRNAIDHGIESIEERLKQGKSELGTITLDLKREGGEVVISLSDDGAGINLNAVRKKAISLGLMKADDQLSNEEIMHFIFSRGFSTMAAVTQISGRGIGMDVVQTEISELGGSISLYSEPGKGTTFIFRLPFTVSMNRALLVAAGGETLAVPIDAVEGVVRVSPYELDEYYGEQAVDFMYAGEKYDFSYLGAFINGSKPSYQPDMIGALPVLLVRAGENLVALQVDRLLGSREIVVKSLGPQFAGLKTASGATILGDGSVVMIADLSALVRKQIDNAASGLTPRHNRLAGRAVAMVVDDSVTVRKVTSRLLERNGYQVISAKDGLEAMALLEEKVPDVMLLDIEMPNLDGFEVVSRVRHDERMQHIPIIMISSRTGSKHRDRALELGANEFLGKPFQEELLLEMLGSYTENSLNDQASSNTY